MTLNKRHCMMFAIVGMTVLFAGCLHHIRRTASTEARYIGDIKTRNRYYIYALEVDLQYWSNKFRLYYDFSNEDRSTKEIQFYREDEGDNLPHYAVTNEFALGSPKDVSSTFQALQPAVFSRKGIPIIVRMKCDYGQNLYPLTVLGGFSFGILPVFEEGLYTYSVAIDLARALGGGTKNYFRIEPENNEVRSNAKYSYGTSWVFSQTARLTFPGDGLEGFNMGGYSDCEHVYETGGPNPPHRIGMFDLLSDLSDPGVKVLSYAMASKLKEMEDSGAIDAALAKVETMKKEDERQRRIAEAQAAEQRACEEAAEARRRAQVMVEAEKLRAQEVSRTAMRRTQVEQVYKPPYKIIDLVREKENDFAYTFSLELSGDASIQTFFGVQNIFANEVRTAYQMEYPNADMSSLRVVVQPSLSNGRIVGRAEVLTIAPVALSYDASARLGKLSVRFNSSQYEEARAWARKNIETLARDKNIALVSGELPPAARFYSLGESLKDGNILEIEFKTE